ncbi:Multidrug resistance protein MdtG [ANME-1 cluster archaeon GoMg1]|nr:Multidrug resistance protein MdtG [ANME-1 cluster archaeon GoMg1]
MIRINNVKFKLLSMQFNSNRALTKIVLIAAICVFSTQFGVTVIAPLLGEWVKASETPSFVSALIFSSFTIVSIPLSVSGGIISDKLGRKPLIVAGLLLYAVASALFPFSNNTYDWIFVRALQGAGAGLFFPAVTALLSEVTSYEERGHALSVYNMGLGAGLAAGPISGGVLFDIYGIHMPFFFCVVFALLSVVLVLLFVHEPKTRSKRKKKRKRLSLSERERKALTLACVAIFFGIGVAAIMGALFSPFATNNLELPDYELSTGVVIHATGIIGVILSAMFVVFVILQTGFGRLMKRVGEIILSIAGLFLCACGLIVLYSATSIPGLFIMSFFLGAGLGAISLGTLTLASKAAGVGAGAEEGAIEQGQKQEQEGRVMGIYYAMFYAGIGGVPLVCGALSDIFSARLMFLGYAVLLLVLMVVVWKVR